MNISTCNGTYSASAAARADAVAPAARFREATGGEATTTRAADSVELSSQARQASSPIRNELVERIKAEIAAGTYETGDKLDIAVDRLARHLNLVG